MMASPSNTSQALPRVAFISGHTDLSQEDFLSHYADALQSALQRGDHFVLGDAKGVDTQSLTHLLSGQVRSVHPDIAKRITVYASRAYNVPKLEALGVCVVTPEHHRVRTAQSGPHEVSVVQNSGRDAARYRHVQRDASLTAASDYDILWFRNETESRALYGKKWRARVSATELNFQRRKLLNSETH